MAAMAVLGHWFCTEGLQVHRAAMAVLNYVNSLFVESMEGSMYKQFCVGS